MGLYDQDNDIALPAILLVDGPEGRIRWKYVGDTVADRPESQDVLGEARRLHHLQAPAGR